MPTDPTAAANLPVPGTLTVATAYDWSITLTDSLGNQAQTLVTYTP